MMILKIIKNTLILILIISIVFIPVLIYFVKFNNNSFIGERLKEGVLRIPELVKLLNLNEPGDARYLYSDPDSQNISIEVISVNSQKANEKVDTWLEDMISETLKKKTVVDKTHDIRYPNIKLLSNEDLNEVRKDAILQGRADLYLIYVGSYTEKESSVGLVIHRDTIFIFRDTLEALSERGYVKDVLEKTTIMHEWGHLLGLDHIVNENCIMDESVEVYDSPPIGKNIPTKYCWEELQELKK